MAARHLQLLNRKLVEVAVGRIPRLIVSMPPRHGKSELVSKYFPVWFLGTFPDDRIILASYEADFAASWGAKARDLMESIGLELWGLRVRPDARAANHWNLVGHLGGMDTAGVGGPLTGKGAKVLLIDDPVKNDKEAMSATYREAAWNWATATAYTRLEPGGSVVLIMTRWHEDDLVGRFLRQWRDEGGEPWEVLELPALAGEDDPLGRQPGEPLWPERFDRAALEKIRTTLGAYWWSALYQQRPQPAGGTIFKREWFRYFTEAGDMYVLHRPDGTTHNVPKVECWRFQTVDVAASVATSADYFVVATWAVTPTKDLLLLDVIRTRVEGPDQRGLIRQAFDTWRPSYVGVERVAYQLVLVQELRRQGLPVRELVPDKDKVARALVIAARYEGGTVYHRAGAAWLGDWEAELVAFPKGEKDDQVDTASYAGAELARIASKIGVVNKPR